MTADARDANDIRTVKFALPAWVVDRRELSADEFACWLREAAALYRYSRGEISLGTAAALAGTSQAAFLRLARAAGLPTASANLEELEQELALLAQCSTNGAGA
jgi:predicted HTH domain antitoxin